MNDIRPPKVPHAKISPAASSASETVPPELPAIDPIADTTAPKRRPLKKALIIALGVVAALIIAGFTWYFLSLRPVNPADKKFERVEIVSGSSPSQIADELKSKGLIRSHYAFAIYTRTARIRSDLQAGVYSFSPSQSLPTIAHRLATGAVDDTAFDVTFYPGGTLDDKTNTPDNKKLDVTTVLKRAGFSDSQIATALSKQYNSPLFAGKPAGTSLEGYVYGDTYQFNKNATVEEILARTFDEFYGVLQDNDLIAKFKQHGLTLYQGITLASIIQREVSNPADQKQVAQVFYLRLQKGMPLGSDVTAYYGADLEGEARSVAVDTPYNTRLHEGLPPGPISSPGLSALQAVADPAPGDYLYFVAGDDGTTHFAHTGDEHDVNVKKYCQKLCQMQ